MEDFRLWVKKKNHNLEKVTPQETAILQLIETITTT